MKSISVMVEPAGGATWTLLQTVQHGFMGGWFLLEPAAPGDLLIMLDLHQLLMRTLVADSPTR